MIRNGFGLVSIIGAGLSAFVGLATAGTAHANQLDSCGGIIVAKGEASCEYRPKEECMTSCTTQEVQGACVAKINTMCEGGCTATSATVECETSCTIVHHFLHRQERLRLRESVPRCKKTARLLRWRRPSTLAAAQLRSKCDRKCEGVEDPSPSGA